MKWSERWKRERERGRKRERGRVAEGDVVCEVFSSGHFICAK